jgi:hypothetical protein
VWCTPATVIRWLLRLWLRGSEGPQGSGVPPATAAISLVHRNSFRMIVRVRAASRATRRGSRSTRGSYRTQFFAPLPANNTASFSHRSFAISLDTLQNSTSNMEALPKKWCYRFGGTAEPDGRITMKSTLGGKVRGCSKLAERIKHKIFCWPVECG